MDIYTRFTLYISLLVWKASSETLTFLGNSVATYPNWNAKQKGTLNFQFKTSEKEGLLLYMQGDTNKMSLQLSLERGRLKLAISHSPEENMEEELGRDLHDSTWHNVTIQRNHRATLFELDGTQRVVTKLHWKETLAITSDLYVGGMEKMNGQSGFLGCIKDLKYSEGYKDLVLQSPKYKSKNIVNYCENYCEKNTTKPQCNKGACVNKFKDYECDCFGTGYEGKYCNKKSPTIFLHSNMDFISRLFNSIQIIRSNMVQVRFKTIQKDGILLTIGKANDFFTLELYNGYIRVETNAGGGEVILQNDRPLHDGQWHDVQVTQKGAEFHLVVDSKTDRRFEQKRSSPHKNIVASCQGQDFAYFGGHFNPYTVIGSESKQGFVGCLQQFYFNEVNVINEVIEALDVLRKNKDRLTNTKIDGTVETRCGILPSPIEVIRTLPETKQPRKRATKRSKVVRPTASHKKYDKTGSQASIKTGSQYQSPQAGKRNTTKLKKSSVAWITAGLVLGALVIILVMVFLVHRFRKKYRGTFMAPRDENGMPYYSSVQATYHIQNGIGKRQGRPNVTDV